MEVKFMQTRITKLLMIFIKITIMFLVMAGIVLINKKYMNSAEGSERGYHERSSAKQTTSEETLDVRFKSTYK